MADDWTIEQVEAVVADYFVMLELEVLRKPYVKAEHNKALQRVTGRNKGSIEFKHQNISAVLRDLGFPWLDGYKPRSNYQKLLFDVVSGRVQTERRLRAIIEADVTAPAAPQAPDDLLQRLEAPPRPDPAVENLPAAGEIDRVPRVPVVDYLAREAANSSLGKAGELFILDYERARLRACGKERLAEAVEYVASSDSGAGFDIRSFEQNGSDRLIEVKTTAYAKGTPFFVTRNELQVSQRYSEQYFLYRVFTYRSDPRLFALNGALDQVCRLTPEDFKARVA